MSDLIKRLRGKYSVGPDGVYEDRDFGSYTPKICTEAADTIEQLQDRVKELESNPLIPKLEALIAECDKQESISYDDCNCLDALRKMYDGVTKLIESNRNG